MSQQARGPRVHERWAHLRFSVIGQLLAAPPGKGELKAAIAALAARAWQHPTTGDPVRFGFSTIERWYYRALKERADPVGVLRRKLRTDAGQQVAISDVVRQTVLAQYAAHKSWSVKLHHDNLVALAETTPELSPVPSYATLRRFMSANGLDKRRRVTLRRTEGAERAAARIVDREVRRYEAEYVNGLWHWDCHHGSRKVLTQRGEWVTPILFGVLDDRSRLACHLQWYLAETAEVVAHGLSQAFQKRGGSNVVTTFFLEHRKLQSNILKGFFCGSLIPVLGVANCHAPPSQPILEYRPPMKPNSRRGYSNRGLLSPKKSNDP